MALRRLREILDQETFLYILKRLGQALLTLFLASILSFLIIQLAPGDFLDQMRQNPQLSEDTLLEFEQKFGLDQPALTQYWRWLFNVIFRFNFGISFESFRPVQDLLIERMPATLLLAGISIFGTWAIAIPLGIVGAVKQNQRLDKVLRVTSYIGQGFPSFITALALLLVAQMTSPLLPVGGMTSVYFDDLPWYGKILDLGWHMILPMIALSLTGFAGLQRLMRGQLLDVLRQDYIQTARAKGLPENKVIYVHALRNAINPLITLLGFEFSSLLSGSFITEFFFNWPGLGTLTLQAVQSQDLYLVMAALMISATMLIIGNLLADLLLKFVDPRIQLSDLK